MPLPANIKSQTTVNTHQT